MKILAYIINGIGGAMVGGFSMHGGDIGVIGAVAGMVLVMVGMTILSTTWK